MTAMRGFADEYDLQTWLAEHVFPVEAKHDEKTVYLSALLGLADSIRHGTVSVKDMYFTTDAVGQAVLDSGIKANLSYGATAFDLDGYSFEANVSTIEDIAFLEKWHNADNGRIKLEVGIHGEYTSFAPLWIDKVKFAKEHNLDIHVHISETLKEHEECKVRHNMTPAQILNDNGVFDVRTTAAHCVFSEPKDWEIFAQKGVIVAHNPISNLKLGSGIAPVYDMLEADVTVGLGTDSVCSNNSHDMFEELKIATILQKGRLMNPKAISSCKAIELAISNGAYAQHRENESGKIKVGYDADLIMIDLNKPNLFPVHDIYSAVVYSMSGLDVEMTMVRGKILYQNGEFKTIDIEKLLEEIRTYVMPKLFGK